MPRGHPLRPLVLKAHDDLAAVAAGQRHVERLDGLGEVEDPRHLRTDDAGVDELRAATQVIAVRSDEEEPVGDAELLGAAAHLRAEAPHRQLETKLADKLREGLDAAGVTVYESEFIRLVSDIDAVPEDDCAGPPTVRTATPI